MFFSFFAALFFTLKSGIFIEIVQISDNLGTSFLGLGYEFCMVILVLIHFWKHSQGSKWGMYLHTWVCIYTFSRNWVCKRYVI